MTPTDATQPPQALDMPETVAGERREATIADVNMTPDMDFLEVLEAVK